jgi:protein-disulfide isomerase
MVLCLIAAAVFLVLSVFSAKYRPLAKEAVRCVFRTITFKPCDTGLDEQLKAEIVSSVLKFSPSIAKIINRNFTILSWIFVLLSIASFAYMIYGGYNFYVYGNCDGPNATQACILNDLTGDYGRFSSPTQLIAPTSLKGINSGNPNASTVIVEFGCFTCPYTKKAEPAIERLLKEQNRTIYYVFKPFPLPNHNNSFEAARAVLCAEKQNKSWDMRQEIFRRMESCTTSGELAIKTVAKNVGLNMSEFNLCFDNNETGPVLSEYIQEGKDSHIYATPTFFINGKAVVGPKTYEEMKRLVEEAN